YYNNPRREINRIKDYVTALTQKKVLSKKVVKDVLSKYRVPYKSFTVKPLTKPGIDFVMDIANEDKIKERIRAVIDKESPIEEHYLMDKLTTMYNIPGTAKKAIAQLSEYVSAFDGFRKEVGGKAFYVDKPVETFRPSDEKIKRDITKIYPDEILAAVKCAIETNVGMTRDSVVKEVIALFGYGKKTKAVADWIDRAIENALDEKQLMITVDGVITT
ncbi:MAG TPA: hypothetical protein IAB11_06805, partial [Candidatus Ornithoclostridium faecavium]|nr:hypothetical protein [Candidatus Ornithoclostridium faecavium]